MNCQTENFLHLLRSFLWGNTARLDSPDWAKLCELAGLHNLIPAVYSAASRTEEFSRADASARTQLLETTLVQSSRQFMRTQELFRIYEKLLSAGIQPLILKGLICRSLYPEPELRVSCDEDLWVRKEDLAACDRILRACGYTPDFDDVTPILDTVQEITYENGVLVIELHLNLFGTANSDRFQMTQVFCRSFSQNMELEIQGHKVFTLCPTEHFLFLFLHLYKHFSVSGAGLRHIMDFLMFLDKYNEDIDFTRIRLVVSQFRGELFYCSLLEIGKTYLGFSPQKSAELFSLSISRPELELLLEDIIQSGCFGNASKVQKLGSTYVMSYAISSETHRPQILPLLFPKAEFLYPSFPLLIRHRWLLPFAWCARILKFFWKTCRSDKKEVSEGIRYGKKRVRLLKKYKTFPGTVAKVDK